MSVLKEHKFDINRDDLYLNVKSRVRTRQRLLQMAELGMEETGIASFGIKGVMSGLYIEKVWNYNNDEFDSYMDWVKEMISKKTNT